LRGKKGGKAMFKRIKDKAAAINKIISDGKELPLEKIHKLLDVRKKGEVKEILKSYKTKNTEFYLEETRDFVSICGVCEGYIKIVVLYDKKEKTMQTFLDSEINITQLEEDIEIAEKILNFVKKETGKIKNQIVKDFLYEEILFAIR